jgi:deoxyribonuclease-4
VTSSSLLGAHVSVAGGLDRAPAHARAIGATAMQIFTKSPNQWRERSVTPSEVSAFRTQVARCGIRKVVAHDSYLINLASPDRQLRTRSLAAFRAELQRCRALGIRYLVTHPGNFMTRRASGMRRNAAAYDECLAAEPGPMILLETTAGMGTALGARFEELAELRERVTRELRHRVGYCADTCHLYAAGYDLVRDWDHVWDQWDRTVGLARLRCLHLNDSRTGLGARVDRHAWIGEGTLGPEPFRRIMREPRFAHAVKILETPKGSDAGCHDRRMLRRLRAYARARRSTISHRRC